MPLERDWMLAESVRFELHNRPTVDFIDYLQGLGGLL